MKKISMLKKAKKPKVIMMKAKKVVMKEMAR
jgi:hypothetical protein